MAVPRFQTGGHGGRQRRAGTMFKGLSTLRTAEEKVQPVSEKAKALQAYLAAQYGAGGGEPEKKKKKKKRKPESGGPGITILDEDVSGFGPPPADAKRGPAPIDIDEEDEGARAACCTCCNRLGLPSGHGVLSPRGPCPWSNRRACGGQCGGSRAPKAAGGAREAVLPAARRW